MHKQFLNKFQSRAPSYKKHESILACANYLDFILIFAQLSLKEKSGLGAPATNITKITIASVF